MKLPEKQKRLEVVALDAGEYFETVERLAERGIAHIYIFDGVIRSAAAKWDAEIIYYVGRGRFPAGGAGGSPSENPDAVCDSLLGAAW